jgi:hypothetical protein
VWRWIDLNHQVVPTLSGHSTADLCLYRTLWANGVLKGVVPSVAVHLGCDVNSLNNPARPYDDPRYGTFQNAESLLFYANQVAVLCHIAWWNQGPSGFGAAIADDGSATVGDCWRRFNHDWSQRADLRLNQADRKRSYEWSIVGDWTLCPA